MAERPRPITGKAFAKKLIEAGIVQAEDLATRVVIDAKMGDVVRLYVERAGDERLLDVIPTLEGVEITSVEAPADTATQE